MLVHGRLLDTAMLQSAVEALAAVPFVSLEDYWLTSTTHMWLAPEEEWASWAPYILVREFPPALLQRGRCLGFGEGIAWPFAHAMEAVRCAAVAGLGVLEGRLLSWDESALTLDDRIGVRDGRSLRVGWEVGRPREGEEWDQYVARAAGFTETQLHEIRGDTVWISSHMELWVGLEMQTRAGAMMASEESADWKRFALFL